MDWHKSDLYHTPSSRLTNTNHVILSIQAEKAFGKIQHLLIIKPLQKLGINEANIILSAQGWDAFLLSLEQGTHVYTLIHCGTRNSTLCGRGEKEIKAIYLGKKEIKVSQCVDDSTVYAEIPMNLYKNL